MKNNPKNSERLMDEIDRLSDNAIADCMLTDLPSAARHARTVPLRRRLITVAAACLGVVMMLGAMVAVPMMRAEGQTTPDATLASPHGTVSESSPSDPEENNTLVRVQMLSLTESVDEEGSLINGQQEDFYDRQIIFTFDPAEGETVSVISHEPLDEKLSAVATKLSILENSTPDDHEYIAALRELIRISVRLCHSPRNTAMVDERTLVWSLPKDNGKPYEIVSFIIRDAEGQPVGAGSVCIGFYRFSDTRALIRHEVLGSVRYDAPVSEETAKADVAAFDATADAVYASMDFTPKNADEGYALAEHRLKNTVLADNGDACLAIDGWCRFAWYTVDANASGSISHRFILLPDGGYYEIADEGAATYDALMNTPLREDWWDVDSYLDGIVLPLADGRQITFAKQTVTEMRKSLDDQGLVVMVEQEVEKWFAVVVGEAQTDRNIAPA